MLEVSTQRLFLTFYFALSNFLSVTKTLNYSIDFLNDIFSYLYAVLYRSNRHFKKKSKKSKAGNVCPLVIVVYILSLPSESQSIGHNIIYVHLFSSFILSLTFRVTNQSPIILFSFSNHSLLLHITLFDPIPTFISIWAQLSLWCICSPLQCLSTKEKTVSTVSEFIFRFCVLVGPRYWEYCMQGQRTLSWSLLVLPK